MKAHIAAVKQIGPKPIVAAESLRQSRRTPERKSEKGSLCQVT